MIYFIVGALLLFICLLLGLFHDVTHPEKYRSMHERLCTRLLEGEVFDGDLYYEENGEQIACHAVLKWSKPEFIFELKKGEQFMVLKHHLYETLERQIMLFSPIRVEELRGLSWYRPLLDQ